VWLGTVGVWPAVARMRLTVDRVWPAAATVQSAGHSSSIAGRSQVAPGH
jgi:hypothetical protein